MEETEYSEENKIYDSKELIKLIKSSGGYIALEESNKLTRLSKGYTATLYKGDLNLGAFILFEGSRFCMRPYYHDEVEETAVSTLETFNVVLAFENLPVEKRVKLFNEKAQETIDLASEKGYDIGEAYEIKDLERFK
jgi:hypothetical protein